MWIDTHCHLDASEMAHEVDAIVQQAALHGVQRIIIPAVERANCLAVRTLAHRYEQTVYALGIHPMYVPRAEEQDLLFLREQVIQSLTDSRFVAMGEMGLDFLVPELMQPTLLEKQIYFYTEQLKMAREFQLPVLLHARRSHDVLLKHLRRCPVPGGIVHAFNGSLQQAQQWIEHGFKLGFGGAMTFSRALNIRRLAQQVPLEAIVLETDAPDMAPAWSDTGVNRPVEIPRIGAVLAQLRDLSVERVAQQMVQNTWEVLPRMKFAL